MRVFYIYFNCLYLAQMAISGQWYGTHLFQDLIVALKMYLDDVFIKKKEQPEAMVEIVCHLYIVCIFIVTRSNRHSR